MHLRTAVTVLLVLFAGVPASAQAPRLDDSARIAGWRSDLALLARELPARHPAWFANVDSVRYRQEVARVDSLIPLRSDAQLFWAMVRLAALAGDAHTSLAPAEGARAAILPLRLSWLDDGVYLTAVAREHAELLGSRLDGVGDADLDAALAAVRPFVAAENDSYLRSRLPALLASPEALVAAGLSPGADRASYRLRTPTGVREITLAAVGEPPPLAASGPADSAALPLYLRRVNEIHWRQWLPESRTMYVQYNRCVRNPEYPMERFVEDVFREADSLGAERLVIDLRLNGGGNSLIFRPFIMRLRGHRLNAPGRVFAIIGRRTFSSGMMAAVELDRETHATLVGEPTGGSPNHFGEVRSFTLPYSGTRVFHSTRLFRLLPGRDVSTLMPELPVPFRFADWEAGRDPYLETILAIPPGEPALPASPAG